MATSASAPRTHVRRLTARERAGRVLLPRIRIYQLGLLAGLLGLWELIGHQTADYVLAPPSEVALALVEMVRSGELPNALGDSLTALFLGYAIAAIGGIAFGCAMGWWQTLGRTVDPFVAALYVVPIVALVPAIVIWAGLGLAARVIVVALFCLFEPLLNAYAGVRNLDPLLVDVARTLGARRRDLFWKVVLPGTLPFLFVGLRIGAGRALKGMVLAEILFAVTGLGGLIVKYTAAFRMDRVLAVVVVLALLGIGLTTVIQVVERRVMRWRP
jgi:ABC-type nitrate/sulfonate/bicarbonate transport system permease component